MNKTIKSSVFPIELFIDDQKSIKLLVHKIEPIGLLAQPQEKILLPLGKNFLVKICLPQSQSLYQAHMKVVRHIDQINKPHYVELHFWGSPPSALINAITRFNLTIRYK